MLHYQLHHSHFEITLSGLVQLARQDGGGPTPLISGHPGLITDVLIGAQAIIEFGPENHVCYATPLITCAGVILTSMDPAAPPRAAVYHAPSGQLTHHTIAGLMARLGNPPALSMLAAFGAPLAWDAHYNQDASALAAYGIPEDQIVTIANLPNGRFGINAQGLVGT